jgi:hypothetical protein
VLPTRPRTITASDSPRQLYKSSNHLVPHAHYSTRARYATQTHLPFHAQVHHNYLRDPIAIWEGYTDTNFFDFDAMASNASSGKRKRSGPKFYAVKVGRKPGIYHSWDDCKAQTDGVKAECESAVHCLYKLS